MLGGEVALLGAIRREVIELPAAGEFRHELPRAKAHGAVTLVLPEQRAERRKEGEKERVGDEECSIGFRLWPSNGWICWPANSVGYFAPATSTHVAIRSVNCPGWASILPRRDAVPPPGCGSTINFPATTAQIGATTTSTTMNPTAVIPTMPVRVTASAMTPAVGIPVVEIRVVEIRVAAISSRKADGDVLQKSDVRGSIPQTARDGICFFDDQNLGKSGGIPAFRDRTASIRGRARGNEQESHPAVGPRWRRGTHPFGSAPSHR